MGRFFSIKVFGALVFLFSIMALVRVIGVKAEFLNVLDDVFDDFKLTHTYYKNVRSPQDEPFEENIVLVNIGKINRRGIAEMINIINKSKPKLIGIDARFYLEKEDDPVGDFMLSEAIKNTEEFVIACEVDNADEASKRWNDLLMPIPLFLDSTGAHPAHVNTGNSESGDFIFWGEFPPYETTVDGRTVTSLSLRITELYDPAAADDFKARKNETEIIYFKGNLDKYFKLDIEQVFDEDFDPELIEGKIVLMGYMGTGSYTDYFFDEDKFYSPLNEKLLGRGFPDMYGVVVHANIISMMLERKYVNPVPDHIEVIFGILVAYLNVVLFVFLDIKAKVWYNTISKFVQLIEVIAVNSISLILFSTYRIEFNLTLTLVVILLSGDLTEIFIDVIYEPVKNSRLIKYFSLNYFKK